MDRELEQKIQSIGGAGLSKSSAEALLGVKFDQEQLEAWKRAHAVYELKKKKEQKEQKDSKHHTDYVLPDLSVTSVRALAVPPLTKRVTKRELHDAIWEEHGIITLLAIRFQTTYGQIWNAVRKWDLVNDLEEAKKSLYDKAHAVIIKAMDSPDESIRLRAAAEALRAQMRTAQQVTISRDSGEVDIRTIFGSA